MEAFVGSAVPVRRAEGYGVATRAAVCGSRATGWARSTVERSRLAGSKAMVSVRNAVRMNVTFSPNQKDVVVITGASSGLGMAAAKELASTGDWLVVLAVRSFSKAEKALREANLNPKNYRILPLDLASLTSVRQFSESLKTMLAKEKLDLNAIVCNAATWHPKDKKPRYTADGFEEHVGTNHLGHFLLAHLLADDLRKSARTGLAPRLVFLGTETHNPDSIAGKVPPQADLGRLAGLEKGLCGENAMIDGKKFEPTKAYKDSKVCNAITMKQMSDRYGPRGVVVSAMFPGCVASSGLFREKRGWFNSFFPWFQKNITKQYVSVEEAGHRLAAVVANPLYSTTGAYWKWNSLKLGDGTMDPVGTNIAISQQARDEELANRLYELSCEMVGISPISKSRAYPEPKSDIERLVSSANQSR
ncbi:Protochlorophyllide reductase A, chloroplastic [Porphyridium purpureum]|uniref:protochlorophyllide reductase n=1 Tax=Porphyridium purpureum TaxID=35688 RepID=A0A5J4YUK9_PORPP|nr:Protochlorophyllide reductase A, chloroplastic [Porphyridium purpureum]|eukprot:POR6163..scf227_4